MGYPQYACAEALKQSNNRLEEAGEMLLNDLETLIAVSRPERKTKEDDDEPRNVLPEDASHVPQLLSLGAELDEARALLEIHGNRLDRAAEELLQKNEGSTQDWVGDLLQRARTVAEKRGRREIVIDCSRFI